MLRPVLALLVLAAFLPACTRTTARAPIEVRRYAVDWRAVDAPVLRWDGLAAQGLVLTPAQWPLEASLKSLLAADFSGVVAGLDFGFHSSSIPAGVLEELYDEGYLPAYVHVENEGSAPARFDPLWLIVRVDDDTLLPPATAEELPERLRRVDWVQTGAAVVAVALMAVLVAAGRKGGGSGGGTHVMIRADLNPGFFVQGSSIRAARERDRAARAAAAGAAQAPTPPRRDPGLLRAETLAPGEAREGFLLFSLVDGVRDWQSARLERVR